MHRHDEETDSPFPPGMGREILVEPPEPFRRQRPVRVVQQDEVSIPVVERIGGSGKPEEPDAADRSGHELNTAADMPGDAPLESSSSADLASDFLRADFSECQTSFDDTIDEVVPGMPLDYVDSSAEGLRNPDVRCETCEEPMRPGVRELYDQRYTKKAFIAAIACLILGFLGAFGVTFFDGYSFGRLVTVYLTGVFLMFGGVLSGVGSFLYLAREKVFLCPCCKRVYPRA